MWTLLKTFCLGDKAAFACNNDRGLGSFLTKNTPMVLHIITNGTVNELLARSDKQLSLTVLGCMLDSFLLTH